MRLPNPANPSCSVVAPMTAHAAATAPCGPLRSGRAVAMPRRARLRGRRVSCCVAVLLAFGLIGGQLVRLALKARPRSSCRWPSRWPRSWSRPDIVDRHGRLLATDVGMHSLYADPHLCSTSTRRPRSSSAFSPASTRRSCARRWPTGAGASPGWRADLTPAAGAAGARPGPAGPRLPHRAQARLSAGRAGRARAGHRQHRQQGHRRHRAHARRGRPRGGRAGARGACPARPVRHVARHRRAARACRGAEAGRARYSGVRRCRRSCSMPARARCWAPSRCPRSTRRARRLARPGARRQADGRHVRARLHLQDAHRRHGAGGRHRRPRQDLRRAPAARSPGPTPSRTSIRRAARSRCARSSCIPPTSAPACWRWRRAPSASAHSWRGMGLTEPMRTEAGPVATPQLPKHWGRIETITVGYGHGLAVAPLQFAAAVAALVNGGLKVTPTLLAQSDDGGRAAAPGVGRPPAPGCSEIMRLNVTQRAGHRPARRGRGLSRRRQDRHRRDAGSRRLSGEVGDFLLRGRVSHGCAQIRRPGAAVRAAAPARAAATTSPPASMPPPPPPASSSASRRCWASCRGAWNAHAAAGPFDAPPAAQ